ncbi:MAG: hypothetical protein JNK12_10625 [Acidimicrobiales bacterium]|nr:hypothetical protein [Acidimicrobiales bacterium]
MTDLTPAPAPDPYPAPGAMPAPAPGAEDGPARTPAHRGRMIAAAVSAGAFVGIGIGLVATNQGDTADPAPVSADGGTQQPFGSNGQSDPFGDADGDGRLGDPGDQFGGSEQFTPPGDQFGGGEEFTPPSDQFSTPDSDAGATPSPFGGQTAPDTNSGGS